MRQTICSFMLLLIASASAQNWCPPGATWNHRYYGCFGCTDTGYVHTEYIGDTLFQGSTCQVLDATKHSWDINTGIHTEQQWGPQITRGQDDLVEKWNGSSFDTLFRFGAVPDESWVMMSTGIVAVLDTGHAMVDGLSLRYSVVDLGWGAADTIFARIGLLHYYLDGESPFYTDAGLGSVRCYMDGQIDYSTGAGPACDFTLNAGKHLFREECTMFPNPGTDRFMVETPSSWLAEVVVQDLFGRWMLALQNASVKFTVDASEWNAGVYLVFVRDRYGAMRTLKWVKE